MRLLSGDRMGCLPVRRMLSRTLDPTPNLILARGVTMQFPVAKRYRELLLHPFWRNGHNAWWRLFSR